jgi:hypothetical protein
VTLKDKVNVEKLFKEKNKWKQMAQYIFLQ